MTRRSYFVIFVGALFLILAVNSAFALTRDVRTSRVRAASRRVRRLPWRPLFRGSHDMLVRQNQEIDRLDLTRIEDDAQLTEMEESGTLVLVKESSSLDIAADLTDSRRYCRPWTREFLEDLSQAFYREFRQPLTVTSLVRTMEQQRKLRRRNRNAGPVEGETASTHLTGITVDISRKGLSRKQHRWLEQYFLPLKEQGLIEPVEERRQAVFHVVVYGAYSEWRDSQRAETSVTRMAN